MNEDFTPNKRIDGKALASTIKNTITQDIQNILKSGNPSPRLDVVLVGENPASLIYVNRKKKECEDVGILVKIHEISHETSQENLISHIDAIQNNADVHGILIQLPLPGHIETDTILNRIHPEKDVDGLTTLNQGRLLRGDRGIIPCTPQGIMQMITAIAPEISGKVAVVLGRSILVGKPIAQILLQHNATVIGCHSKTKNLESITKTADIIVAAIGSPLFVKSHMIKPGAILIDVGINRHNGTIVGDVDFDDCLEKSAHISPVPGGVGPMTVVNVLYNTLQCYKHLMGL